MAKNTKKKDEVIVENPTKLQCPVCGKQKLLRFFYKSKDPKYAIYGDGRCYYCKDCLKDMCYLPNGIPDKEGFKKVLKEYLNLPFYDDLYRKALDNDKDTLGFYISQLNIAKKGASLTWDDGQTDENTKVKTARNSGVIDEKELHELTLKWGNEWNEEELLLLEQTYKELGADKNLKYNSSKQYLKLATMNYVRSYTAMKQGNVQDAEKYTKLFNETMKMGEFNPSALAKNSNLEKLGSFCDFSLMVEECIDVIDIQKILPEYMQQPRDLADKVIWYNVNYMQDALGMKRSSYEDIYKFYSQLEADYYGIPLGQIPRSSTINDTLNIKEDDIGEEFEE